MKVFSFILFTLSLYNFSVAQTQEKDNSLGRKTFEMVKKTYGIYTNESLLMEVTNIGREIEKNLALSKPLTYFLVDTPEPNAFATAGGYVYVTRGLLSIINTRDELAGVMAHELSHVIKHHPTKKLEVIIVPALLELPGNLLGALTQPEIGHLVNLPIELPSSLAISSFSRSQEREADLSGVDLAIKSGFQPYGLVTALERLTAYIEYITKEPMKKNAFIDHPVTSDRVAYLTTYLKKHGYERPLDGTGTTMTSIDGLIYGQNPKYGLVQKNAYVHPVLKYQIKFPADWSTDVTVQNVTSISKDKKNSIILSYDTTSNSIENLANKARAKFASAYLVETDTFSVNGLHAIRLSVNIPEKGYKCEMIWYQIPNSKYIVKALEF